MCGRYTNTLGPEEIVRHFRIEVPGEAGTRRFNVAPTEDVMAIVAPDGQPQIRLLRWGLHPAWARNPPRTGASLINARMETVASKPSFRELIPHSSHRALQIADGYFEWLKQERRGLPSRPIFFQVDCGIPFAFAALWKSERIDGRLIESCTTLTCDSSPNRVASAIHDRMPVILADSSTQRAWLDRRLGAQEALALCGALPTGRISATPANPALNRTGGRDGPELLVMPVA
jgi:putative SOS response-associated peptidase YedK